MVVANENIDRIIELIKSSKDSKEAKDKLLKAKWKLTDDNTNLITLVEDSSARIENNLYKLTETQARSILELRLHRLTSLERGEI